MAIIMLPVADMNLQTFLEKADIDNTSRSFLRPFFGCLTSALSYLHDNRIRHKDIKPSNVLIKHDQVYLTDFGTSLDWSGCDNSTTVTAPPTTPRYCAPEVMAFVERNTSSDIWSLGCVFLEMWTVLKHFTLDGLKAHMSDNGTHVKEYHHNFEAISSWIQMLENTPGPSCDRVLSKWIQNMLQHKPKSRWNCHILANHIQEASVDPSSEYAFQGLCCLESDDDTTDETESCDRNSEAEFITPSLPTVERRDAVKIVGVAASGRIQLENVMSNEAANSTNVLLLGQHGALVPRKLVKDCAVPHSKAFVEEDSESLARELCDHSISIKATDESEDADPEYDGLMHCATDSDFSSPGDEILQEEEMVETHPPPSATSSLHHSIASSQNVPRSSSSLESTTTTSSWAAETLKPRHSACALCDCMLSDADDVASLPCGHWIHKSCYAQGRTFPAYISCDTCNLANRKPASQANRYFCESNDWAQRRNEAQDSLRSYDETSVHEYMSRFPDVDWASILGHAKDSSLQETAELPQPLRLAKLLRAWKIALARSTRIDKTNNKHSVLPINRHSRNCPQTIPSSRTTYLADSATPEQQTRNERTVRLKSASGSDQILDVKKRWGTYWSKLHED